MMKLEIKELDIREMHWDSVEDWSRLCPSKITVLGTEYVSIEDVWRFYEVVVRDVARKLGREYKEIRNVMDAENTPFLEYTARIFEAKKMYTKDNPIIWKLHLMLIAPQFDTMNTILKLYYSLHSSEKEKFKESIGVK